MPESNPVEKKAVVRRVLRISAVVLGSMLLLVVIGMVGIWGYYWDFAVGIPGSQTCENCHTMQPYQDSMHASNLLASRHAIHDLVCTDCHETTIEQQIHETWLQLSAPPPAPLARTKMPQENCLACHEHGSYEQLAWRSMDLGISDLQAGGTEANPHQSPHYMDLECQLCHRVHRESTLYCAECHTYDFDVP